jgi:tetratricopeptide (TPR) repeat protein
LDQFVDARRRAHRLLDFCDHLDERKFSEKQSVLSDVYSRLGNAYLELGDYNKSLEFHNRDLKIAETKQFNERSSRALDNLGRVYARSGQFPQAIQVWERKIPLATSPLEKAWLFHEIGQCHFGLGDYERSKRYGERSYTEAVDVSDPVWQLNAKVLVAHSQTKLREYRDAEQTFDEALVLAKDQRKFFFIKKFSSCLFDKLIENSKYI